MDRFKVFFLLVSTCCALIEAYPNPGYTPPNQKKVTAEVCLNIPIDSFQNMQIFQQILQMADGGGLVSRNVPWQSLYNLPYGNNNQNSIQKQPKIECKHPYQKLSDSSNSCVYAYITGNSMNWKEARTLCNAAGGDLLFFRNPEEFSDTVNYLRIAAAHTNINNLWIGGSDLNTEGHWRTIDGVNMHLGRPYWQHGEPNALNDEDCAILYTGDQHTYQLVDGSCNTGSSYPICQQRFD